MSKSLVVTVLCDDRAGVVDDLSEVINAHGGLWVESRMASLAGKFAGILRVQVSAADEPALIAALHALQGKGLQVLAESGRADAVSERQRMQVELMGQDRPGIVHHLSHALAQQGISFDELETETVEASMAGGSLFKARATVHLPESVDLDDVREQLEAVANELTVDIHLGELN